jgi:signal transduction histidine kinase
MPYSKPRDSNPQIVELPSSLDHYCHRIAATVVLFAVCPDFNKKRTPKTTVMAARRKIKRRTLPFTVDSALLRELGERLIGKNHVALAELVKNSYDADANEVLLNVDPGGDTISVIDDGHGMTFDEFKKFWMRIGTPHKGKLKVSRRLKRPLTGSKGVGRLSVQYLADEMKLQSVVRNEKQWLEATINWNDAIRKGLLTEAKVHCKLQTTNPPFPYGTSVTLNGLKHAWDETTLKNLGRELWWLQPPFHSTASTERKSRFDIALISPNAALEKAFKSQITAILDIWTARLVGRCNEGKVDLSLQFHGDPPRSHSYSVSEFPHNKSAPAKETSDGNSSNLQACDFEIRIYTLKRRQPQGIKVDEARSYFDDFGGVHVYDAGFHLPYYGNPKNDWLQLEFDHSHRRTSSDLLPEALQITRGMNNLPTAGRIFGVANVITSKEPGLKISVGRDRLADSRAFEDLRCVVRYALDFYAVEETRRKIEEDRHERPVEQTSAKLRSVEEVLEDYQGQIPEKAYDDLHSKLRRALEVAKADEEAVEQQLGLLGPLATAGICAVAYQHELKKQFAFIEDVIERLKKVRSGNPKLDANLVQLADDLVNWLERARLTNALFDSFGDSDNSQLRIRLKADAVIREVKRQTGFLARGAEVATDNLDKALYLPKATFIEWTALFQNVFINAFNAMLDSEVRVLSVSSRIRKSNREILVQDTGSGVEVAKSEELFRPFVRKSKISAQRQALGYGGTGLGLAIVKLIADTAHCSVKFVEPTDDFKTAFSLSWKEEQ